MDETLVRNYLVVINEEGQYSIWPQDRDIPAGWKAVGPAGTKDECLSYIREAWTDMTPRSLRQARGPAAG